MGNYCESCKDDTEKSFNAFWGSKYQRNSLKFDLDEFDPDTPDEPKRRLLADPTDPRNNPYSSLSMLSDFKLGEKAKNDNVRVYNKNDPYDFSRTLQSYFKHKAESNKSLSGEQPHKYSKNMKNGKYGEKAYNMPEPSPQKTQEASNPQQNHPIMATKGTTFSSKISAKSQKTNKLSMFKYSEEALDTLKHLIPVELKKLPPHITNRLPAHLLQINPIRGSKPVHNSSLNSTYVGEYSSRSLKNGFGHEILKNGSGYLGDWKDGKRSGIGRVVLKNGNFYIGQFINDKANGLGFFFNKKNNIRYIGEFKDNLQHGNGREFYLDTGCWYEGDWKLNKKSGQGSYFFAKKGGLYEGEWEEGAITGKGRFFYKDGGVYEGEFLAGAKHGIGRLRTADGRVYEGGFVKGRFDGPGVLKYVEKGLSGDRVCVYDGGWRKGVRHGKGTVYSSEDGKKVGIWDDGMLVKWVEQP